MAGGEIDMAVAMYKRSKSWLALLKLVQQHRREQLPQAHLMVAQVRLARLPSSALAVSRLITLHGAAVSLQ